MQATVFVEGAHHPERPAQLGHRLASGHLGGPQLRRHLDAVGVQLQAGGADLHGHQAHSVCNDVVHLCGDPPSLARDGRLLT